MTREIEARLRLSAVDRTGQVFKSVAGKMDQVNRRAGEFNKNQAAMARSQERMAAIGRIGAVAGVALAAGARAAVIDFAAVERQMERIGITADASAEQTKAAFQNLQQVTKQFAMPLDDGIRALDTLVSSGLTLQDAMAFLPSVLATAQASGAATEDIANTAIKASSALKIEAGDMQRAFDIMVAGGKAGQFELKDMASFIPELANSFSSLGYSGQDGLKELIALLQTLREDTGTAEAAATQAQNIFGKMFSSDTAKKFSNFGIDLRKEMDAAKKSGEDAVSAFVRLSKEAVKGDLSKLPLLFTDQEFRLGMQSLMTSADSYEKFIAAVNSSKVDGTVMRDVGRVLTDTQSKIDQLAGSWDKLKLSMGETIAPAASAVMDSLSKGLDFNNAKEEGAKKRGYSWLRRNLGFTSDEDANDLAYEGGYRNEEWLKAYQQNRYSRGKVRPSTGRQGMPISLPEFPGSSGSGIPVPMSRPSADPIVSPLSDMQRQYQQYGQGRQIAESFTSSAAGMNVFGPIEQRFETAAKSVADGGKEGADAINGSADKIRSAGTDAGSSIAAAAEKLSAAAQAIAGALARSVMPSARSAGVNADTGRSMPPQATGGGGGF
ncbi:phage tail tape measure protein [Rhizobium leguminosarum]|uniref:phage tail tape measure protein n=1 Tax=Rhizobium leguminosarum TaxID=384 RepID=UPI001C92978E|nr:phage tail tape measure protein [Rhizobium leguminosarum]MBY2918864.1 phage tail tape measure protein [Rhizobium leguminosarum]MBY2974541.1 phage tail tape measure protein [Rhizobium leguminosarum]MBY2981994.1 phage tail tape measure protein [Rhizobium leguminosarum]MBY3010490.1 phage tail tape measure protein [Rhizobium leguminosarum]